MIESGAVSQRIAIVGAGFAGLTLAWALRKRGLAVEIFEAAGRTGGLLRTDLSATAAGGEILVENAANALLASRHVEELFADLQLVPVFPGARAKNRWVYRGRPRRIPLGPLEIVSASVRALKTRIGSGFTPRAGENLAVWGERCFGRRFVRYLISPALQGVYGCGAERLSAELIVGGLQDRKNRPPKGGWRGSVSAAGGMQQITEQLTAWLLAHEVKIHFKSACTPESLTPQFRAVVVATGLPSAQKLIAAVAPQAASLLAAVPMLPLTVGALGFARPRRLRGFGCLFPQGEGFHSLGVLFNSDIFAGRGELENESWILTDETSAEAALVNQVLADRAKLLGETQEPVFRRVIRHPAALPLYGTELRDFLNSGFLQENRLTESRTPLYLTGNYLGGIGLTRILTRNIRLAEKLANSEATV